MLLAIDAWLSNLIPDRGIIYWLFFANYLLALGFVVSEIYRSRTSQGSIAWILGLLILPFPMTFFYAVFGLKLFDDYAAIQTHSGRVLRKVRSSKTKILDQPSAEDWPVLVNVSQIPFLKGNEVELLSFEPGELICDEHDRSDGIFIVRTGLIKVRKNTSHLLPYSDVADWGAVAKGLQLGLQAPHSPLGKFFHGLPPAVQGTFAMNPDLLAWSQPQRLEIVLEKQGETAPFGRARILGLLPNAARAGSRTARRTS